jgi:hypothetical protein
MNFRHIVAVAALTACAAGFAQTTPTPAPTPDASATSRGTSTPVIDKHEASQEQRIKEGRQSGALTRHESRRLHAEQKAVDRTQTKAAADGTVTPAERQRIRKMQNKAGKDVYRQKHDGASAPATGK